MKILVLDDEKLIRWSLHQILRNEGYDVETAATKEEALRLAASNPFGLIFADFEICGGQGSVFFSELLSSQTTAKLVILTAAGKDLVTRTLSDIAKFSILEKPFATEDIKTAARNAFDRNWERHEHIS